MKFPVVSGCGGDKRNRYPGDNLAYSLTKVIPILKKVLALVFFTPVINARAELRWLADTKNRLTASLTILAFMSADRVLVVFKPLPVSRLVHTAAFGGIGGGVIEVGFNVFEGQRHVASAGLIGHQKNGL